MSKREIKSTTLMLMILMVLISLSCVSAQDTSDLISEDTVSTTDSQILLSSIDENVLESGEGSFTELAGNITAEQSSYTLTKDYVYTNDDADYVNGIVIDKDFTINGDGKSICGNDVARIFNVTAGTLTLNNVTLCHGNASGGAGVYVGSGAALNASDVVFSENVAVDNGGAIFTDDGTITLSDCVLDSNDVSRLESSASENRGGAAIYAKDANVTLVNTNVTNNGRSDLDRSKGDMICAVIHLIDSDADITGGLFENNTGIYGGAINAESSTINTLSVSGATFNNNKGYNGGAINLHNIETTISDSNFTDNWVVGPGSSGYYGLGGAIAADGNGSFSVTGSNFTANRATGNGASAGAISVGLNEGYSATIDGCEFKENTAVNKAGAVFIGCYDATISNSVFSDDNVAEIGDAIYNAGNLELSGNIIDSTDSEIYSSGSGKVDTHVWVIVNDHEDVTVEYYDTIPVVVKITDDNGNLIRINETTLTIDMGSTWTRQTLTLDEATGFYVGDFLVDQSGKLTPNRLTIQKYFTSYNVNANLNSSYVNMIKADPTVEVYYDNVIYPGDVVITVNVTGKAGAPKISWAATAATPFKVTVNDVEYKVKLTNGIGTVTISDLPVGDYVINASWDGNTKYNGIEPQYYDLSVSCLKGTYTDLQYQIDHAENGVLDLTYDFVYNATYDGDKFPRGVLISESIAIDGNGFTISGNNSYRIFYITAKADLNNINFVNGSAKTFAGFVTGGAIYFNTGADGSSVEKCNFTDNYALSSGGAIYTAVPIDVADSNFTDNVGGFNAGAIHFYGGVASTVSGSNFVGNNASGTGSNGRGGAIFVNANELSISNSNFTNNRGNGDAGAIFYANTAGDATIVDSNFVDNTAAKYVSAIYANAKVTVTGSNFTGNDAIGNGVIFFNTGASGSVVSDCIFNNTEDDEGYDIVVSGSVTLERNNLTGNINNKVSGSLELAENNVDGIIYNYGVITSLVNATLNNNQTVYDKKLGDEVVVNATLTDDNGNAIYDPNFRIAVDDVAIENITYDESTCLYTSNYTIAHAGEVIVSTSYESDGLVISIGIYDVPKANATLTVTVGDDKKFAYGDNVTVFISLLDNETYDALTENITLVIDDVPVTVEVIDGEAIYNITDLEPGQHAVMGIFDGNINYNGPVYDSDVFEVLRPDRILSIEVENIKYGDIAIINITVTDSEGNKEKGTVSLNISGTEYVYVVGGDKSVEIEGLPVGEYHINATLMETEFDAAVVNDTESFTVGQAASSVKIIAISDYPTYPDDVSVMFEVVNATDIQITISKDGTRVEDANIVVSEDLKTVTISGLGAGDYTINITNVENGNYTGASDSDSFTVYQATPVIRVTADDVTYNADVVVTVLSDASGDVTVTVGGKTVTGAVEAGVAQNFTISGLVANETEYAIAVKLAETQNYTAGVNDTEKVRVMKAASSVKIYSTSITTYPDDVSVMFEVVNATEIAVNVYDANGAEITKGITLDDGIVIISDLAAGEYTIVITNAGSDNYIESYDQAAFEVYKATVTIKPVATGDMVVDGEVNITFTVPKDIDGMLNVTIDGETVVVVTVDENGTVTIPDTYNYAGKHTVIVTLTGDTNYNDATGTTTFDIAKVTPVITISDVEATVGDTVEATVTIDGGDATGFILYDGVYYPVENGQATIPVTVTTAGPNTIDVFYTGDEKYLNGTADNTFNASKAASTIDIIGDSEITTIEDATVIITVGPEGATGHVAVTLDGESYGKRGFPLENGVVTLENITLTAGPHTFAAKYDGDKNYNASDVATWDIVVILAPTEMDLEITDAVYGETAYIYVFDLPEDATGNVTAIIGGKEFSAYVEEGEATIEVTDLAADKYEFEVTYSGDSTYDAASEMVTIEIIPAASTVEIDDIDDVVYNASVEVTYTVKNETEVSVTVYDADGTKITEGITLEDGKVIIAGLNAGEYTIEISNAGDENHTESSDIASFNVLKATISIDPVATGDFVVDGEVNITFTVPKDIDGMLNVTIDGEPVLAFMVIDGTCIIPGTYDAGKHTVVVTLTGDTNYEAAPGTTTFDIAKVKPEITISDIAGNVGDTVEATVTIDGGDATGYVFFDGDLYIVENGQTTIPVVISTACMQAINVYYTGDAKYNNGTGVKAFNDGKAASTIEIDGDKEITTVDDAVVIVTVGPEGVTGTVDITVDGEPYGEPVEVIDGVAMTEISGLTAGNHTIAAQYTGDTNYNASEIAEMNVTVGLAPTDMDLEITDAVYGETAYVIVSGLPEDATGNVTVTIGDNTFTAPVEDGLAVVEITGLAADEYEFEVSYSGDDKYEAASDGDTIEITPAASSVEIDDIGDVVYNESVEVSYAVENATDVTVTVYDADGSEITEGITVDDDKVIIAGLDAGEYTIVIYNAGDENHTESADMATFKVLKDTVIIEPDATGDMVVDGEVNITFTVPKDIDGILTVTIDGELVEFSVDDGTVTITDTYSAGPHTVVVTLSDDTNYEDETGSTTFEINKVDPDVTASDLEFTVGNEGILEITGPSDRQGNLIVSINGTDYAVALDRSGLGTLDVSGLAEGTYTVDITYIENDKYNAGEFTDAATITVNAKADTPITVKDVYIEVGETATVNAVVPAAINGQKVTISVNGEDRLVTVKDGKASARFTDLTAGEYEITVSYAGDNANAANSTTATLTVGKVAPETSIEATSVVAGNDVIITVTVPEDAIGTVYFDVDGKNYYALVEDGEATLILSDLPVGNYAVEYTYGGDDKYLNATGDAEFEVSANDTYGVDVFSEPALVGEDAVITVVMPEDATGEVTVTVEGETYSAPIVDGVATIVIPDMPAGEFDAYVEYAGDDKYAPFSAETLVIVDKVPDAPMDVEADPVEAGEDAVVEVTLPEDATGEVTVTVDGKNYTAPVKDGKATVTVPGLPAGDYTADVTYSGDDKYEPVSDTAPISVDKVPDVPMDVEADPVEAGEDAVVEVTLPEDATGEVTVTVDGKNYTAPVKDGKATVTIPELPVGSYPATVSYSGDDKYDPVSSETPVTVNKVSDAPINASADPVEAGETAIIEVNLPEDATGAVVAEVDGDLYAAEIESGYTEIFVPGLQSGNHTATVTYYGDDKYEAVNTTVTLKVGDLFEVFAPNVEKYYHGPERFNVYVLLNGEGVADKTVKITLNGVTYERTTDENGTASIGLNLNSGQTYNVTVKVDNIEINSTVTIKPTIVGTDVTKIYKNGTQYYATFYDREGNLLANTAVAFNINGVFYNRTTDANGVAKLNINLLPGEYIITAINPDSGEMKSNTITVLSQFVEHGDLVKVYGTSIPYVVKVRDKDGSIVAGKVVNFNINGVFYNRTSDSNGLVRLNINLMAGEYIITATLNGERVSDKVTVLAA